MALPAAMPSSFSNLHHHTGHYFYSSRAHIRFLPDQVLHQLSDIDFGVIFDGSNIGLSKVLEI